MARERRSSNNHQERMLEHASSMSPFFVARTLNELLDQIGDEPLEPRWRDIWLGVRRRSHSGQRGTRRCDRTD